MNKSEMVAKLEEANVQLERLKESTSGARGGMGVALQEAGKAMKALKEVLDQLVLQLPGPVIENSDD